MLYHCDIPSNHVAKGCIFELIVLAWTQSGCIVHQSHCKNVICKVFSVSVVVLASLQTNKLSQNVLTQHMHLAIISHSTVELHVLINVQHTCTCISSLHYVLGG